MLGAFFAVFVPKGLGGEFGGWLLIHGTTELFAIVLAGAAGFRIGMALAFPGRLSRIDSAVAAGRGAGVAMAGVMLMQIGRAHVCTPVTNAHLVCRLLLANKNKKNTRRQ